MTGLLFACGAVLVGAVIRGYSGFGASMVWVASLSLVFPPAAVVPSVLALEVVASIGLLPRVWRDVEWRQMALLLAATLATMPLGVLALTVFPERTMRVVVAVSILLATLALASGVRIRGAPGPGLAIGAGAVSGVVNGATAIGGPPAILLYFSSDAAAHVGRATLIAYFLGTDSAGFAMTAVAGLVTMDVLTRTVALVPVTLIGIWAGQHLFERSGGRGFRSAVLVLLAVLAAGVLVRTLLGG